MKSHAKIPNWNSFKIGNNSIKCRIITPLYLSLYNNDPTMKKKEFKHRKVKFRFIALIWNGDEPFPLSSQIWASDGRLLTSFLKPFGTIPSSTESSQSRTRKIMCLKSLDSKKDSAKPAQTCLILKKTKWVHTRFQKPAKEIYDRKSLKKLAVEISSNNEKKHRPISILMIIE